MEELTVGTRMYNHGDICNQPWFGTITQVYHTRFGTQYQITPDAETGLEPSVVSASFVSPVYLGNGLTRIVTEEAYRAWKAQKIAAWAQVK